MLSLFLSLPLKVPLDLPHPFPLLNHMHDPLALEQMTIVVTRQSRKSLRHAHLLLLCVVRREVVLMRIGKMHMEMVVRTVSELLYLSRPGMGTGGESSGVEGGLIVDCALILRAAGSRSHTFRVPLVDVPWVNDGRGLIDLAK